jgi:hypothetical protein
MSRLLHMLAVATALLLPARGGATVASVPPVTSATFAGTWEAVFNDSEPWLVRLRVNRDGGGELRVLYGSGVDAVQGYFVFHAAQVKDGRVRLRAVSPYPQLGWSVATLELKGEADAPEAGNLEPIGALDGTLRIFEDDAPDGDEPNYTLPLHLARGMPILGRLGAMVRALEADPNKRARAELAELARHKPQPVPYWLRLTAHGVGRGTVAGDAGVPTLSNRDPACGTGDCDVVVADLKRPPVGSTVTLTARPEPGSVIGRWTTSSSDKCAPGASTCTVRVPPIGDYVEAGVRFDLAPKRP